ncbi:MAG: DUF1553 domain-containing protein [Pirellulaceae bacterium]|nr:DUF1553 domain-containing protein [Pirellulaceae bacterium]
MRNFLLVFCLFLALAPHETLVAEETRAAKERFFENKIRPLLLARCVKCHGPEEEEAGLRLDQAERLFRGGESGRVVVAGDLDKSRLIQLVRGSDDGTMPPSDRLPVEEIALLERWVEDGAIWPGYEGTDPLPDKKTGPLFSDEQKAFWAFQPLAVQALPAVENSHWSREPVDRFVLAAQEAVQLGPAAAADRLIWLRRLSFDLTGLPPTQEAIARFSSDASPDAASRLVDRLLAAPAYGERWGRHWLDNVRFAESAGHDGNNGYLYAWRYRDYVIDSFNRDRPYDQFIVEQIAGDLLPQTGQFERDLEQAVATGFLQVGPKPVVMRDKRQMLLDIADEQVSTLGVTFLAMTIGCARCHDHKFDPIPTQDYYSLTGIFTSTHVMFDDAADSMWIEPEFEVPGAEEKLRVMSVKDFAEPKNLAVHLRGNYRTLGEEAPRRFLQILAGEDHAPIESPGSGRLELAHWIATEENPLTARVLVNRLWQNHFGTGIVPSADDFGVRGQRPTHPELLDWLSSEFLRRGWSIKALHRILVQSASYAQAVSTGDSSGPKIDPENQLLWHMPRRRLAAEEIRDAILFTSDTLDRSMGGTLFTSGYNFNRPEVGLSVVDIGIADDYQPFKELRRSIYLPVIRNQMNPMLTLFNTANEHIPVTKRAEGTVAPQALFLMNSRFSRTAAWQLALVTRKKPAEQRIREIFLRLLSREPNTVEFAEGLAYINRYRADLGITDNEKSVAALPTSYANMIQATPGLLVYYPLHDLRTVEGVAETTNAVQPQAHAGRFVNGATFDLDGAVAHELNQDGQDPGIQLNGTNQRIQIDDVSFLDAARAAISVEYWIKPNAMTRLNYAIGLDDLAAGQRYWKSGTHVVDVNGVSRLTIFHEVFGHGGYRFATTENALVELDTWSHVVFTLGEGHRQLFVNGELVDEMATAAQPTFGTSSLTFGSRADDSEWLAGGIDEVAIYGSVLDERTVRNHFMVGKNRSAEAVEPDLVVWQSYCQALFCMNEFLFVE